MQFAHGYHAAEVESADPGTKWRVTPAVSGPTYVIGDLSTRGGLQASAMDIGSYPRALIAFDKTPLRRDSDVLGGWLLLFEWLMRNTVFRSFI